MKPLVETRGGMLFETNPSKGEKVDLPNIMDIVYIVGTASRHHNIELLYSMRSVYKFLTGFQKIYIVGHKPDFVNDQVIHLPARDGSHVNKEKNIYEKLLVACNHPNISQEFFCVHDDHFLLVPFQVHSFPYAYKPEDLLMTARKKKSNDRYRISVINTWGELKKRGFGIRYYDIHIPCIFDKDLFKFVMSQYDWGYSCGYCIKSLYCNTLGLEGVEMTDSKIRGPMKEQDIRDHLADRIRFSVDDPGITETMKNVFQALYPDPSPWEKPGQIPG